LFGFLGFCLRCLGNFIKNGKYYLVMEKRVFLGLLVALLVVIGLGGLSSGEGVVCG
jgi:hypothetical protein